MSGKAAGRSGSQWKTTRHDVYFKLAKEHGYRARSAFKLIQLNKKFNFLSKCKAVLDLCAAPGGWLQVCQKFMPANSLIVGVDILPIRPIPNVINLQEDITTESCRVALRKEFQGWQLDAVVHDGAPDVGGATWSKDAYMQNELVIHSLKLATQFLREGGTFVTKVFRSQDYNAILWVLKQFFKKTTVTKPASSRNASAEIFVVCEHYLAPKKIDPRLLNPETIFKQDEEEAKRVDVFHQKIGKKNRAGYADGTKMHMSSKATVANFIESNEAIDMLGMYNSFDFDEESKIYLEHKATDEEVKALCKDLKVLGKSDFSYLLKWRKKMLAYRQELMKEEEGESEEEEQEPEPELTKEEKEELEERKLDEQLKDLRTKQKLKVKKEKKKKREKLYKEKRKQELNMNNLAEVDQAEELDLFALKGIKSKKALDVVHKSGKDDKLLTIEEVKAANSDNEDDEEEGDESASDSDDDRYEKMERDLDAAYEQYRSRRKIQARKKKTKLGLKDEEAPADDDDDDDVFADDESDENEDHALQVNMGKSAVPSKKDILSSWFDRDLFGSNSGTTTSTAPKTATKTAASMSSGLSFADEEDSDDEEEEARARARKRKRAADEDEDDDDDEDDDEDDDVDGKPKSVAKKGAFDDEDDKEKESTFEEVPMESDYSSDSDAQAEVMAMGQLMLRKRSKNDLINSSYNRYTFHDEDDIPEWFHYDEGMHNRAQIPVSKEAVNEYKQQLKAMGARSIKKVSEAKARKKMKAMRLYTKAKEKAESTIDNKEASMGEKMRIIKKMHAAKKMGDRKKTYMVAVSSRAGGAKMARRSKSGKDVKRVDKREKADNRGLKASERRKKRGAKTKNKKKHKQ